MRRYGRFWFWSILVTVALVWITVVIYSRITPISKAMASSKAQTLAVTTVHNAVNDRLAKDNVTYDKLVDFTIDKDNNIKAIKLNIIKINSLKATLVNDIAESITNIDSSKISIPLGNLTGNELLQGVGPRIKIKLLPIGYSSIDVKSSFTSAGINQTKHEVYLEINTNISVILPLGITSATAKTTILVAETIIVGNVPQTYAGIDLPGITSLTQ